MLSLLNNIKKKLNLKNIIRMCITALVITTIRYILIIKLELNIKEVYDFFFFFTTTGIAASIVNIIYDELYPLFSLKPASGADEPNQEPQEPENQVPYT